MKPVDSYKKLQSIAVSECYFIYVACIDCEWFIGQPGNINKQLIKLIFEFVTETK